MQPKNNNSEHARRGRNQRGRGSSAEVRSDRGTRGRIPQGSTRSNPRDSNHANPHDRDSNSQNPRDRDSNGTNPQNSNGTNTRDSIEFEGDISQTESSSSSSGEDNCNLNRDITPIVVNSEKYYKVEDLVMRTGTINLQAFIHGQNCSRILETITNSTIARKTKERLPNKSQKSRKRPTGEAKEEILSFSASIPIW